MAGLNSEVTDGVHPSMVAYVPSAGDLQQCHDRCSKLLPPKLTRKRIPKYLKPAIEEILFARASNSMNKKSRDAKLDADFYRENEIRKKPKQNLGDRFLSFRQQAASSLNDVQKSFGEQFQQHPEKFWPANYPRRPVHVPPNLRPPLPGVLMAG